MTFSIVIPTKNRPKELLRSFIAIINQTRLPDQVIIVDQSNPKNVIKKTIISKARKVNLELNYLHNEKINGLVQAKDYSISYNQCDYISFFDDDILIEKDYFLFIERAFKSFPGMIGVNGVITNIPKTSIIKNFIFKLTHFGIFKDNRPKTIRSLNLDSDIPKNVNVLSGGLSTWKKQVFEKVSFDTKNKFHSYEDIEFSIRVEKIYPNAMFIIPKARLSHHHASLNRQSLLLRTQNDVIEVWMLFKKNKNFNFLGFDFFILILGLFFNSIFLNFRYKNLKFINNFLSGFILGFKKQIIRK
tara:strand:- start:73 stop:975 length:903 start_codon:yes stop_codon:yes gene_type:complete